MSKIYYFFVVTNIIITLLFSLRVICNSKLKTFFKNMQCKSKDGFLITTLQILLVFLIPIIHIGTLMGIAYMFIVDEEKLISLFR